MASPSLTFPDLPFQAELISGVTDHMLLFPVRGRHPDTEIGVTGASALPSPLLVGYVHLGQCPCSVRLSKFQKRNQQKDLRRVTGPRLAEPGAQGPVPSPPAPALVGIWGHCRPFAFLSVSLGLLSRSVVLHLKMSLFCLSQIVKFYLRGFHVFT